jgi:hypothetical protein
MFYMEFCHFFDTRPLPESIDRGAANSEGRLQSKSQSPVSGCPKLFPALMNEGVRTGPPPQKGKTLHSPDIKSFLRRNHAGLKKPIKKKFFGGEARGFGGFCIFAGEEVALAVHAELGSAGLLS